MKYLPDISQVGVEMNWFTLLLTIIHLGPHFLLAIIHFYCQESHDS